MSACFGIWLWACIVYFVVQTIFAVMLVELVHPVTREGISVDCPECQRHFSSVLSAKLWLFTALFSGGWEREVPIIIQAAPWTWYILVGSMGVLSLLVIKEAAEIVVIVLSRDHMVLAQREVSEAPAEPVQTMEPRLGTDIDTDTKLLQLLLARFQQDQEGRARLDGLLTEFRQAGAGVAQHPPHIATKEEHIATKEDALETAIVQVR
ncbi:CACNA1C [Symbiodinium sp. CCMP2456]|nr:CACNA1C [Symbiodinium sp. CCMP2456]